MASNEIPYAYDPLVELMENAVDGAKLQGASVRLKQNFKADIRAAGVSMNTRSLAPLRTTIMLLAIWFCADPVNSRADDVGQDMLTFSNILARIASASHGTIALQGEVVDPAGQQLSGVSVQLQKIFHGNLGENGRMETETRTVNGVFDISVTGFAALRAIFSKEGYYSQVIEFAIPVTGRVTTLATTNGNIQAQVLMRQGLRVTLEKKGQVTELPLYGGPLEYEVGGRGKVVDFTRAAGSHLVGVADLHSPNQLPKLCAYVVPERELDGKIAFLQVPIVGKSTPELVPRSLTLIINDPEGGFVVGTPAIPINAFHQMKQAPVAGYARQLTLDSHTLLRPRSTYFYVKVGGKYGKGVIGNLLVNRNTQKITLGIGFRLQQDGSVNLETDEGLGRNFTPLPQDNVPPQSSRR